MLGIQPLNHVEHATQIIAEATALLELDNNKRVKIPTQSLDSFLNSILTFAKKTREQPSAQEIVGKLNNLQPIVDDITLIKNAVNNTTAPPITNTPNAAAQIASWADVVRSSTPSYPSTPNSRATTNASVRDREVVVKLDANAAAILRKVSPEEICKRVNEAMDARVSLLGKGPRVISAKQLKSGDVVLHTATTAKADTLKGSEEEWAKILGTTARVIRPTFGVIVHGVRTSTESIDTDNQERAIEKIETENALLHEGAKVTYAGWLTREGRKKATSSLVVEFTTKHHANRVIREGLVLNAIQHDCVLYDRSCKLKQCYRCHEYGHIGPQCDANERCGYCAEAHNTKECMRKDADPKPTPKCVLCKGQHTAWSSACPRRRRELARVEQARKTRPIFHYESEDLGISPIKHTVGGKTPAYRETATCSTEGENRVVNITDTPTPSLNPSQTHPYDLRRSVQSSSHVADEGWQTAYRRRRTLSPQKSTNKERSRSPRRRGRPPLAEKHANASTRTKNGLDKPFPGENTQTLESFFQLNPSQQ